MKTVNISAADRAYAELRKRILSGDLAPGAMISESEEAELLDLSRTPVRAALLRLQTEGWVTIYPQRGALVRELTATEVRESAEVRRALESAGVAQAPAERRAHFAERLQESLTRQQEALHAQDYSAFEMLTLQFHRYFVELADNRQMLALYDGLQDYLRLSIVRMKIRVLGDPHLLIEEHHALADDAVSGDWVSFTERLHHHQSRMHALH
ncbi:GntR family transcriptional regulator [Rhodococcus erythropolis]|uniref:GntR family transcriptional regulator n=1 Tax=Rhodococcus erythropolis TaxID=1833 RepID=UPI0008786904|nr:GntR family transcriptional regulator [Rhodococcus erythropolis]OFV72815.1 HTH-type transcriptional regulator McbR [Rhodococcus erythropolis]